MNKIEIITKAFNCSPAEIENINSLKKGMTNDSFVFTYKNGKYILRIPGAGTEKLINRKDEYDSYQKIIPYGICDNIVYMDPETGYKITVYVDESRVCDPFDPNDIKACMKKLREFHELGLSADYQFDVFEQINYYESLLSSPSSFSDYKSIKENVFLLKEYIDAIPKRLSLSHIDSVPDNFLFVSKQGREEVMIIDWEYAAMQDPHIDIAMFILYNKHDEEQVDDIIDSYFIEGCPEEIRVKIYAYIAACGFLWSSWGEYKSQMGADFGDYPAYQYQYAKKYYQIFADSQRKKER